MRQWLWIQLATHLWTIYQQGRPNDGIHDFIEWLNAAGPLTYRCICVPDKVYSVAIDEENGLPCLRETQPVVE